MPSSCCCVPECHNRGGHSFPSGNRRKSWIHAVRRGRVGGKEWIPNASSVVCRQHFTVDDYIQETVYGMLKMSQDVHKQF